MRFFIRSELRQAGARAQSVKKAYLAENAGQILSRKTASASDTEEFDIFLSHRHLDNEEVLGLVDEFEKMGYSVYVDTVQDANLKEKETSKDTADTLKKRMKQSRSLFFATSQNYSESKWMPWELGYFDGVKQHVAVCPVTDYTSTPDFKGQEYLSLYPYISRAKPMGQSEDTLWVHESPDSYIIYRDWLKGQKPFKRS
ncbi:toll/interleukin-1 receptor domain-containing protein [Verrucomicrobiota bacterium sgz303538]